MTDTPDQVRWLATNGNVGPNASAMLLRYADLLERTQWRPIESAPRDGSEIIYRAHRSGWYVSSCVWRYESEDHPDGWWDDSMTEYANPTYWMPMPKE